MVDLIIKELRFVTRPQECHSALLLQDNNNIWDEMKESDRKQERVLGFSSVSLGDYWLIYCVSCSQGEVGDQGNVGKLGPPVSTVWLTYKLGVRRMN